MKRSKKRDYDHENAVAANIILSDPERHGRFGLDWARRFRERVARGRAEQAGQRMLPLRAQERSRP